MTVMAENKRQFFRSQFNYACRFAMEKKEVHSRVILTVLGAIVGIAIGHLFLAVLVMQNEQGAISGLSAAVFLQEELWIIGYAVVVGFVASLIPAWTAYQTDIAKQLTKS